MSGHPVLRLARHCNDPDTLAAQYRTGLGLQELGRFTGHAGHDGVMLGWPGAAWHLELVRAPRPRPAPPDPEDALVLYLDTQADAWRDRALAAGFEAVMPGNPYWRAHGHALRDAEGFVLVLAHGTWPR